MHNGIVQFDLQSFVNLLTHYSDGEIPKDLEVINFGPSGFLPNWYAIVVKMDKEWPGAHTLPPPFDNEYEPFHFRFEGDKILTMNKKDEDPTIKDHDPAADLKGV